MLALAAPASCAYLDDWGLGGWTDRLGLSFSDDCQENSGLAALFAWAGSWLSGRGGQQRSAHCETKESACPPGVPVTGLQVKGGHVRKGGNRELYDFRLRCGSGWQHGWLGLRFDVQGGRETERGAGICPEGNDLTGVQVMRGRSAGPNSRDCARPLPTERMHAKDIPARCLEPRRGPARACACGTLQTGLCCALLACAHSDYTFKLRCAKQWRDLIGLPFEALRETRSATCPHGRSVSGIRVHREPAPPTHPALTTLGWVDGHCPLWPTAHPSRQLVSRTAGGFQDWGSIDTYEFQLQCLGDDADVAGVGTGTSDGDSAARLALGASAGALPSSLSDLLSFGAEGADAAWQLVHTLLSAEADDPAGLANRGSSRDSSSASPGRPTRAAATRATNRRAQVPQQRPVWRETVDEL